MKGKAFLAIAALAALVSCQTTSAPPEATSVASILGRGYLEASEFPDARKFIPPPPADGTASLQRDEEASLAALALRDTARWDLAVSDADILSPAATGALSCAAGFEISPEATPKLDGLLRKAMANLALSTREVKHQYQRPRPFMVNDQPQCTPDWEDRLRQDGSYPSGHSAIGFGWAVIVAELVPERAAELVARGRVFADSRRICNVHWLSDTEQGMAAAVAMVARLHASDSFGSDMDAARDELAQPAVRNTPPLRDCAAEAAAIALAG